MKAILFDLDGTLLPMDADEFFKEYINSFQNMCVRCGFEPQLTTQALLCGMKKMISNDGSATNEDSFWDTFFNTHGNFSTDDRSHFIEFYEKEFIDTKKQTSKNKYAAECIKTAKQKGFRLIIATNPMFPKIATKTRMDWAGLCKEDFEIVTTYEDYSFTKPSLEYYNDILKKAGINACDCLMVGNDAIEDMCVEKLGMDTFLVTDCLINKNNIPIEKYKQGSLKDCNDYIASL